jgi:hypothetical protein
MSDRHAKRSESATRLSTHPQSGAIGTDRRCRDDDDQLDARDARRWVSSPAAANERWHDARHSRADVAPLLERARRRALDADLIRMTRRLAAA